MSYILQVYEFRVFHWDEKKKKKKGVSTRFMALNNLSLSSEWNLACIFVMTHDPTTKGKQKIEILAHTPTHLLHRFSPCCFKLPLMNIITKSVRAAAAIRPLRLGMLESSDFFFFFF